MIIPYLTSLLAVPGYWLSVQYLERVGRKDVQLMGFCMMGLLFFVCGVFRDWFLEEGAPFSRKVLFFSSILSHLLIQVPSPCLSLSASVSRHLSLSPFFTPFSF